MHFSRATIRQHQLKSEVARTSCNSPENLCVDCLAMKISILGLASCILALMLGNQAWLAASQQRMVFAHYLIYFDDSIETLQQEIRLAQSKGIDAFALNTNIYRKPQFDNMYEAARSLGTGFKLFFSADIHDGDSVIKPPNDRLSPENIVSMLADYRTHPNQLQYKGKSFFTSWLGNQDDYWQFFPNGYANAVAAWSNIFLRAGGKNLYYFLPFFPTGGDYFGVKDTIYVPYGSLVDGTYGWDNSAWNYRDGNFEEPVTSPGDAPSLQVSNDLGKTYMAMVSPWFFKNANDASCCVSNSPECDPNASRDASSSCPCQVKGDYQGSGLWLQKWSQIIANPAPLVEIVTWNDWFEGHYIAPPLSASAAAATAVDVSAFPHHAYLELGKHFINWYKTGTEPVPAKDELYLFYYTQSHSATVPGVQNGCGILHANILTDAVYVVAVLQPGPSALVTLTSGKATSAFTAKQGVNVHGMGFQTGTQSATITRGSVKYTLTGQQKIRNSGLSSYNFNVYSIFCADVQNGLCGIPENVNSQGQAFASSSSS